MDVTDNLVFLPDFSPTRTLSLPTEGVTLNRMQRRDDAALEFRGVKDGKAYEGGYLFQAFTPDFGKHEPQVTDVQMTPDRMYMQLRLRDQDLLLVYDRAGGGTVSSGRPRKT